MQGKPGVVIAATWGYPPAWKSVRYEAGLASLDARSELESRTTLEPLVEALSSKGYEPEKLLVFSLDTVAAKAVREAKDYHELVEENFNAVLDWIDRNTSIVKGLKDRLVIEVAPNVGVYGGCEWRFGEGLAPGDTFASIVFRRLAEALVDVGVEHDEVILVLDTSHGINYMPTLALQAAIDASLVASVAARTRIRMLLVNSEPVTQETRIARIHELLWREFAPVTSALRMSSELPRIAARLGQKPRLLEASKPLRSVLSKSLDSEVNNVVKSVVSEGLKASAIIAYSLALAAAYYALDYRYDVSEAAGLVSYAIDLFKGYTRLDRGEKCRVEHQVGLVYETVRAVAYSAALNRYIGAAYTDVLWEEAGLSAEILHDRGVYLDELRRLSEMLGSPNNFILENELERGIGQYTRTCRCDGSGEPQCQEKPPLPVYCVDWPGEKCDEKRIDLRNFVAHAGLAWDAIEVTIDEAGVAVRYRDGCWDAVKKMLESLGRKLGA